MSEGGYFLGHGGGLDHGGVDSFPVGHFPELLLDHGLDVEVVHGLLEDGEAVERYLKVGQVGWRHSVVDLPLLLAGRCLPSSASQSNQRRLGYGPESRLARARELCN